MLQKIDHIGIAVQDLQEAIQLYEKMGFKLVGTEEVADQMVKVAFFPIGEARLELLEPTSEASPIAKFIAKKGAGIHHIAFRTDDTAAELNKMQETGIRLIDKKPRSGAHNTKIGFLHPKSTLGVLMEICELSEK
ncbi:MAG TPA: methylmalonyl-CoA epimerase [Candidatus Cloacimonas sp.]|jgi:methylmalonyl-CoA epimerase|nr:methylmalonyl-CoA/ethylmalonyl-CoA epimerase [Candidatus Cloacimonadota bacterium]HCX73041.1 methylmalonyl-CoA epimerase [Candidatus Cloacimonas sp.]